jgi:Virulence factor
MARYRIVQWRDLPSLVEAMDGPRTVRVPLSQRFQDLIDAVAMREGASESEAYLEGWAPGPEAERPGDAETVAREVAAELEAGFPDLVTRRMLGPPR